MPQSNDSVGPSPSPAARQLSSTSPQCQGSSNAVICAADEVPFFSAKRTLYVAFELNGGSS